MNVSIIREKTARRLKKKTGKAADAPLLQLVDVTHAYGDSTVLDRVSLRIHRGECVSLVGENGSGKSTLLRVAAGRERPSAGSVVFDGEEIHEDSLDVRKRVASVMDPGAFYPDLTVREHLRLVALSHGMGAGADAAVDGALESHRLTAQSEQFPSALSSGQTQALLLAAAFIRPHDLLILDEPEQRLDSHARTALARLIAEHRDRGAAVLMATHHRALNEVADQIVEVGSRAGHSGPSGAVRGEG
ncbi:ATP-binding cassette domain-containing protein [Kitasatospora sp. NPDC088264]|uniref:ABC transporter ATP-binding protein n=1 Tax=Kitasatospora sp. NPDC088264 TaxID=3155296 RepID=UPI003418667C